MVRNFRALHFSCLFQLLLLTAGPAFSHRDCVLRENLMTHEAAPIFLERGINLAGYWQKETEKRLSSATVAQVRALGFDFVRLPISDRFLVQDSPARLQDIRCDLVTLLNSDFSIIVDFHPSRAFKNQIQEKNADEALTILEGYWKRLRLITDELPKHKIYLSLMNEPPPEMKGWWKIQGRLIERMQSMYPGFSLIAMDRMGGYWRLYEKSPYPQENVLYDFHFYNPMFFTHHNAQWMSKKPDEREKNDNIHYPSALQENGNPAYKKMEKYMGAHWDKEKLERSIKSGPLAWSKRTGAKVICLEFGVYKPYVDPASRSRWLEHMKDIFEGNNIPWAIWDYDGGFGLFDRETGRLDTGAARALGLNEGIVH